VFVLKVFAAIVTADAVDRHMREQQHRAWVAEDARRRADQAPGTDPRRLTGPSAGWDAAAPERPT
jgi:hypothetical protein